MIDDQTRMTETIPYQCTHFAYPMSLVSPPILLQTRVAKTNVCRNQLGSVYQDKIWADNSNGGESGDAGARKTKRERHRQRARDTVMDCATFINETRYVPHTTQCVYSR